MREKTRRLFWDIINCPWTKCQNECKTIKSFQEGYKSFQVPEPWSGDIEGATFLVIGSNPAFDGTEIFPSKTCNGEAWAAKSRCGKIWTDGEVERFFEGRMGQSVCACERYKRPYVAISNDAQDILHMTTCACDYKRSQNNYWGIYRRYCSVIAGQYGIDDTGIAITDLVHCKSAKEIGVSESAKHCSGYLDRIIDAFVNSNDTIKAKCVLIFGKEEKRTTQEVLRTLSSMGRVESKNPAGSYNYRKAGLEKLNEINLTEIVLPSNKKLIVVTNLPTPSGSNRAASPATIFGNEIVW